MKIWFCGLEFVVGSGVQDKYLVKQQIYENNSSRNYLNKLCAPSQSCQNKNVLENLVFGKMDREMNSSSSTCCHPLVHCILWVKCELASRLRECRYETFRYGEIFKMKRVLMSDFYLKTKINEIYVPTRFNIDFVFTGKTLPVLKLPNWWFISTK